MLGLGLSDAAVRAARSMIGYPTPTLDLSMMYGTLDSRVSFSRASLAWQTDVNGVLVTAPHNLLTESESFDASAWTKTNCAVTSNAAPAPDSAGTTTADKIVMTATAASVTVTGTVSSLNLSNAFTFSIYLKAGTCGFARIRLVENGGSFAAMGRVDINLTTGAIVRTASGGTASNVSSTSTDAGNGWWRVSVTATLGGALTSVFAQVYPKDSSADTYTFGGTIGNDLYVWGAQLEQHGSARSYLNTSVKNLLGYSEAFDNAAWTKTEVTISANATTAPDGTVTADKVLDTVNSAVHFVFQSASYTTGVSYTYSVYAKAAERSLLAISAPASFGTGITEFDLNAGTATRDATTIASGLTATITAVGNGWYRCAISGPATSTASGSFGLRLRAVTLVSTYAGTGTSGLFLWGAQLSSSGSLDPYVPTVAAAPASAAVHGPRFDYDPATLAAKGLLIEEARTNLWLYSEVAASWINQGDATITTNSATAPDGMVSADLITMGANATVPGQNITLAASTAYTVSLFIKEGASAPWLRCRVTTAAGSVSGYFNLATFAVGTLPATMSGATFTNVGGGWWRMSVQYLPATGDEGARAVSFSGVATNGGGTAQGAFTVWGAQVEAGSFATSYIPTVASTVTRAVDVAVIQPLGSWFNAAEGTLYAEFSTPSPTASARIAALNDGTTAERVELLTTGSGVQFLVTDASVTQAGPAVTPAITADAVVRLAGAYAVNDFQVARGGALGTQDTAGTLPTVTTLRLGAQSAGAAFLNGHIRRVKFFNSRLADSTLQSITT